MVFPPTVDGLYDSARRYARMALDAHASEHHHLVALDAGTALEHLAKACLARRSPVLIAELRNENSFRSVLLLLGITAQSGLPGGQQIPLSGAAPLLRTVGLRSALQRTRMLVTSTARWDHVMRLADMRDGTVHAAADDEVEMGLLVAFVQHANALLADLRRDRAHFWGHRLPVADALLAHARDAVAQVVEVKLAAARVKIERYRDTPLVLDAMRQSASAPILSRAQAQAQCPACMSQGVAGGFRAVVADSFETGPSGNIVRPFLTVRFTAESYACPVCGLRLTSAAEIAAAGMASEWDEGPDRVDNYSPPDDEDAGYERWREDHHLG